MKNTIGKFRNATAMEEKEWASAPMPEDPSVNLNLYPLHGYIAYNAVELPIEKTDDGYLEVHAPGGQHFTPDILHTLLCNGMKDMRDRLYYSDLEACGEECKA